jgi:hypothetical protein
MQPDTLDFDVLHRESGYWYLATPYSKYAKGIWEAFEESCRAAAWLIRQGISVYCPIAHTHPVALHGGIDPLDHQIWIPVDAPIMAGASGLIVCMMDGWEDSYGIAQEIAMFGLMAKPKPIFYMEWPRND